MVDLGNFPLVRLRVVWAVEEPLHLRGYLGNTLRGALGTALRDTVCNWPDRDCVLCSGAADCAWVRLFRTSCLHVHLSKGAQATPTPPIVLEPPLTGGTFEPGDELALELVLVGNAIADLATISRACEHLGDRGVGNRRSRVRLVGVDFVHAHGTARLYAPDQMRCHDPPLEPTLATAAPLTGVMAPQKVLTVRLLTPLRLKSRGRLRRDVDFAGLVEAADWRIRQLETLHTERRHLPERETVLAAATRCTTATKDLRWEDWDLDSVARGQRPVGGLVGTLCIEGEWHSLLPLLRLAEQVHVGKGATYGLGRIALA